MKKDQFKTNVHASSKRFSKGGNTQPKNYNFKYIFTKYQILHKYNCRTCSLGIPSMLDCSGVKGCLSILVPLATAVSSGCRPLTCG